MTTAVAEPTTEYNLDLSNEDIAQAYPTFYGQVVNTKHYFPKEGSDRHRIFVEVKPYDETIQLNKRGTVAATYWFTDDSKNKAYNDFFKLRMNLKNQGVANGNPEKAVGHEGWWKLIPPSNGYDRPMQPVNAPKDATVPPRPSDWDLDAWISQYANGNEDAEEATQSGTEILPSSLFERLIGLAVGTEVSKVGLKVMRDAEFKEHDLPTVTRTLAALVEIGTIRIEDGKYRN